MPNLRYDHVLPSQQIIRDYLKKEGWQEIGFVEDKAICVALGNEHELLIPLRTNLGDYSLRMTEVIATLAKIKWVSHSEIIDELRAFGLQEIGL